jgi:hypothetical protein
MEDLNLELTQERNDENIQNMRNEYELNWEKKKRMIKYSWILINFLSQMLKVPYNMI